MSEPALEPYACSLGTVVAHEGLVYVIATADGRTIGIPANDQPGPAAVEFDIVTPPPSTLTAAEAETLLDAILDGWARERGYASAARCITYVGDPDATFNAEGVAMRNARSALWVAVRDAAQNSANAPYTEAAVRAFAASFAPVWPS